MGERKEYFKERHGEPFEVKNRKQIEAMGRDEEFTRMSRRWAVKSLDYQYTHHFKWLGRPILQFPQDIVALQELIWKVRPEVVVETGIARGGSLVLYASLLELIGGPGEVIGIDVALRKYNRDALKRHSLSHRIQLIDGSSIDPAVVQQVRKLAGNRKAMVVLDSNHAHAHVIEEMRLYSTLVKRGSYLIVSDTWLEDFPRGYFPNRPWDKGNNPATAVAEFLSTNKRFQVDEHLAAMLGITCSRTGYLRCIRNARSSPA